MWTDRQAGRQADGHVAAINTGHNAQPDSSYGCLIRPVHRHAYFTSDTIEQIYKKFRIQ